MKNFSLSLTTKGLFDSEVNKLLSENPSQALYVDITKKPKKRSLPANNAYYAWLPEISDALALTVNESRRYIKLNFGLNILMNGESKEGMKLIETLNKVNFFMLPYADKLEAMDSFPVTSLMVTSQHNLMRDHIQHFFGQQGVILEYKRK